jgi:hypothetical protein
MDRLQLVTQRLHLEALAFKILSEISDITVEYHEKY